MKPSGIETATFRLTAQCLNQLALPRYKTSGLPHSLQDYRGCAVYSQHPNLSPFYALTSSQYRNPQFLAFCNPTNYHNGVYCLVWRMSSAIGTKWPQTYSSIATDDLFGHWRTAAGDRLWPLQPYFINTYDKKVFIRGLFTKTILLFSWRK